MLKNISILILSCVLFVNLFEPTFSNYCDSNVVKQALNLGTDIYLGRDSGSIWKFNPAIRRTVDRKLNLQSIFGNDSFDWIESAFTFDFDDCDPFTRTETYCEATNKAKDIVVVFGKRRDTSKMNADSRKYGYLVYHLNGGQDLIQLNATEDSIVWDLSGSGSLTTSFWVQKSGDLYYESSVFVKSRNELIVSVFDTSTFVDSAILLSKQLANDGQWSEWTEKASIGFRGMFEIDGKVFGFDKKNNVFEFKWSDDNSISFEPISNLKELLNCFGNSSLWERSETVSPLISDPLEASTPSVSTTTATTFSIGSISTISTVVTIDGREEENEINVKTETINYETTGTDVTVLANINESSTLAEPQINEKMENMSGEELNDSGNWSGIFIVAILLLICVIVVALIIIIRNKSKSRMVYLNSKSDDSKSAEIPLNMNNNEKSLHTKDV